VRRCSSATSPLRRSRRFTLLWASTRAPGHRRERRRPDLLSGLSRPPRTRSRERRARDRDRLRTLFGRGCCASPPSRASRWLHTPSPTRLSHSCRFGTHPPSERRSQPLIGPRFQSCLPCSVSLGLALLSGARCHPLRGAGQARTPTECVADRLEPARPPHELACPGRDSRLDFWTV
jgi:hypothetical protein